MDIAEQHNKFERDIVAAQTELRKISPSHDLLKLVEVDNAGIHYTDEFGARYEGMTTAEGFNRYIDELKQQASPSS